MTHGSGPAPAITWARHATVAATALILSIAIIAGFWFSARTLALLFAAIIVGEAVAPIVDRLARKMPKGLAVILLFLALVALLSALVWFIAPKVADQGQQLVDAIPKSPQEAEEQIEDIGENVGLSRDNDIMTTVRGNIGRFGDALIEVPLTIVSSVAEIVLITFMAAYWLLAREPLSNFMHSLVPDDHEQKLDDLLESLSATVGGYVRGVGIGALIIGVVTYIGLTLIGVEYAAVLAILAGFGEVVPIVGPIVTAVPAVIVAFLESPTLALIVLVFYVVLQQVESNLIVPNVMSQQADIPPVLVIVAISAGGGIGGILGAIIAIPLVGAVRVLILQIAAPAIRHWTGASKPIPAPDNSNDRPAPESS